MSAKGQLLAILAMLAVAAGIGYVVLMLINPVFLEELESDHFYVYWGLAAFFCYSLAFWDAYSLWVAPRSKDQGAWDRLDLIRRVAVCGGIACIYTGMLWLGPGP